MKGSVIIEFEYDEEALGIGSGVEKPLTRFFEKQYADGELKLTHLEGSAGSLADAFGVELIK
jgi:hypothetical protein